MATVRLQLGIHLQSVLLSPSPCVAPLTCQFAPHFRQCPRAMCPKRLDEVSNHGHIKLPHCGQAPGFIRGEITRRSTCMRAIVEETILHPLDKSCGPRVAGLDASPRQIAALRIRTRWQAHRLRAPTPHGESGRPRKGRTPSTTPGTDCHPGTGLSVPTICESVTSGNTVQGSFRGPLTHHHSHHRDTHSHQGKRHSHQTPPHPLYLFG